MSQIIDSTKTSRSLVLSRCTQIWRSLLLIVAASWFLPNLAYADTRDSSVEQNVSIAEAEPVADNATGFEHAPALNMSVCAPDGVAIGGYDLVTYYGLFPPQLGDEQIYTQYLGLVYRFVNVENRLSFLAEPQKYVPSYRGWCSTNLSMGRLACPDYTNYKIENDKLLFFEKVGFTNGLDVWNSDPSLHKRQANQNFGLFSK